MDGGYIVILKSLFCGDRFLSSDK